MPGRRTLLLLPLLAIALLSCAELPIIKENRCGNGFIKADEDCDEFSATGGTCNPPGVANQCRFHCENTGQCQSEQGSGWRCGVDQVCRRPQGGTFFAPVSSLIVGSADSLFSGDFDNDGRKDLLAVGPSGFDVHYFTSDGGVAKSLHVPGAPMTPAIGKLTATDADDFTIDVGQGIGVMLGRPGQTIEPTSYTSLDTKERYQNGSDAGTPDDMSLLIVDTGSTIDGPMMTKLRVRAKLDFSTGGITTELVVLIGTGEGSFDAARVIPLDGLPVDLALVNTDEESDMELVVVEGYLVARNGYLAYTEEIDVGRAETKTVDVDLRVTKQRVVSYVFAGAGIAAIQRRAPTASRSRPHRRRRTSRSRCRRPPLSDPASTGARSSVASDQKSAAVIPSA